MIRLCHMSGGMDSSAAIIKLLNEYPKDKVQGLFVNYGQPYAVGEQRAVNYLDDFLKSRYTNYLGYTPLNIEIAMPNVSPEGKTAMQAYFPVRNLVIAALSINVAVSIGAAEIATGTKRDYLDIKDDWAFRDSGATFFDLLNALAAVSVQPDVFPPPRFVTPLRKLDEEPMSKTEVMMLLLAYNVDIDCLWSCFGNDSVPCGTCHACQIIKEEKEKISHAFI